MKAAISVMQDGNIHIVEPTEIAIRELVEGGHYDEEWALRRIENRTKGPLPVPRAVVEEWAFGKVLGGLTEIEALDIIQRMSDAAQEIGSGQICQARYQIELTDLPERYFRNAFRCPSGIVQIDMPLARGVHMDNIRVVRNRELAKVSGSPGRQPEELEAIFTKERKTRLQYLRDIPQTYDLTTPGNTPAELRAMWPPSLALP